MNLKQYIKEFSISMFLYIIAVFFSIMYLEKHSDSSVNTIAAMLPVIPAILMVIVLIRALGKMDELQLIIQMKSFAISFLIVGLATFTYGFLENLGYPKVSLIWIFPFMISTWGLTVSFVKRSY